MKIKKIVITILAVAAIVFVGTKGKGLLESRKTEIANEALPVVESITVSVIKAEEGSLVHKEKFLAKLLSQKSIKLSTKLAGFIQSVKVVESDMVKKGDILIKIDEKELAANKAALHATLAAQKADYILAKSVHATNLKLYQVGGLAKEKLDASSVGVKAKASMLESTKQKIVQLDNQLSYLTIRAPFDGVIDRIFLHEGDLAAAGKPILSMSSGDKKLLFSYAPTKERAIVKGKEVLIDGEEVGVIKSIYSASENGLSMAEVTLKKELSNPIGSSINIEVVTQKASGCKVPSNALLHKADGTFIMIGKEGKFKPYKVEVLMQEASSALISNCPDAPIAVASEVRLASLPAYSKVTMVGEKDE
jgi:RND family efflux transporter MFP subunit